MACVRVEKNNYTVDPLRQWDLNRVLTIHGLSLATAPEVHFAHDSDKLAVVRQSTMDDSGVISVTVPNALLEKPLRLNVYICSRDGDVFKTLCHMVVPVERRAMPSDWDGATDDEVYSLDALHAEVFMVPSTADATVEKVLNKDGTWTLRFRLPDKGATDAANAAKNSANLAAESASSAATSAKNATESKNTAQAAAQSAESSMTDAEKSADSAEEFASTAGECATQAKTAMSQAEQAKASAESAADSANTAMSQAKTSATNANTSASQAKTSATSASTSASHAQEFAGQANQSADEAKTSATHAEQSAQQAQDFANRIENMGVQAVSLSHDKEATVTKTSGAGAVTLTFGIPSGKSAYQYAVDSGYTGTEKEFMQKLAAEAGVFYVADGGTPHSVDTQVFDGGTPFTTDEIRVDCGAP